MGENHTKEPARLAVGNRTSYPQSVKHHGDPAQRRYSLDDYFAVEAMAMTHHEYYRGEIFAMAGASLTHNRLTLNILTALRISLRAGRCAVAPELISGRGRARLAPGR